MSLSFEQEMVGKYNKALGYTLRMRSLVRRVSRILTSSVVDTWNGRRRGRFAICCFPLGKTLLKYDAGIGKEIIMIQKKEHGCSTFGPLPLMFPSYFL